MNLLAVRRLSRTFPGPGGRSFPLRWARAASPPVIAALSDVSFEVPAGEVVALLGESGAGKTTAIRIIARLLPATSGEIWFAGANVLATEGRRPSLGYRSRVQMIFQDPFASLNPMHTVGYHLERPLRRHRRAATAADVRVRVAELLETVGLRPAADFARRHPHELSGGQRQRVAIARALAVDPQLILADEPTSMLDVSLRIGILDLLRSAKEQRGMACLFVTHDLGACRYLADQTLVMFAGRIVESGPTEALFSEPAHPYTQALLTARPGRPLPTRTGSLGIFAAGNQRGGCAFAPRCPAAMQRCHDEQPELLPLTPLRQVRCHLYDSRRPGSGNDEEA